MTRWIHGLSRELLRAVFGEYFGVSADHADIICVLFGRPQEYVPVRRLKHLISSHRPPNNQALYERIRVLREIMEPESLISGGQLSDLGYALSEVGFQECQKALAALADVLAKGGSLPVPGLTESEVETLRALPAPRPAENRAAASKITTESP